MKKFMDNPVLTALTLILGLVCLTSEAYGQETPTPKKNRKALEKAMEACITQAYPLTKIKGNGMADDQNLGALLVLQKNGFRGDVDWGMGANNNIASGTHKGPSGTDRFWGAYESFRKNNGNITQETFTAGTVTVLKDTFIYPDYVALQLQVLGRVDYGRYEKRLTNLHPLERVIPVSTQYKIPVRFTFGPGYLDTMTCDEFKSVMNEFVRGIDEPGAVIKNEIRVGMTMEEVRLAMSGKETTNTLKKGTETIWIYDKIHVVFDQKGIVTEFGAN